MKSDVDELMPRLLPVEEYDVEDFDPSLPPRNPQEYLRQVQLEASMCPDVMVAQIDPKKLKKNQTVNISLSGCQPAPEGFSPSLKWQQLQVANFSDVRQNVNKHREHWKLQSLDNNVVMPNLEDEEGWLKFCLGEKVYFERLLSQDDNDNENPGIDYVKMGFPPLLSIVSRLSQASVTIVLEYLINWLGEKAFTSELASVTAGNGKIDEDAECGRWLYALLACLEKPLLPEAHSLIRHLARRCSEVRASLESKEDKRLSALNLLICLLARYFEQNDLADKE